MLYGVYVQVTVLPVRTHSASYSDLEYSFLVYVALPSATKTATYLIYSTNNGSKDNKGTLYDETGSNKLKDNDDGSDAVVALGGYKYDFLMEQALEEGKTYYIKVTVGYVSGSAPSKYTLNIVEKTA